MARLYDVNVNKERWEVIDLNGQNYHKYKIIDKENHTTYMLNNVIGIEQVKEDEFLVFKRYNHILFEIVRLILKNSETIKIYDKQFSKFKFINDNKIMFTYYDNSGNYRISDVYDIKENKDIDVWLKYKIVSALKENKSLLITEKLYSSNIGDKRLIFTVDSETLMPNSLCYSSLRDNYIKIQTEEDFRKLKLEEERYIRIIDSYYKKQEEDNIEKAKKYILNR